MKWYVRAATYWGLTTVSASKHEATTCSKGMPRSARKAAAAFAAQAAFAPLTRASPGSPSGWITTRTSRNRPR